MSLSIEEVRKIAELSRLKLSSDEEKRYAETISAVLDYMKILNEVETDAVEITSQVTGLTDVFRSDEAKGSGIEKNIMSQMPQVEGGELVVPEVFEE